MILQNRMLVKHCGYSVFIVRVCVRVWEKKILINHIITANVCLNVCLHTARVCSFSLTLFFLILSVSLSRSLNTTQKKNWMLNRKFAIQTEQTVALHIYCYQICKHYSINACTKIIFIQFQLFISSNRLREQDY